MALLEFEGDTTFTLVFDNVSGAGSGGTGGYPIASQPEAEAGITNTSLMTPLRTTQAVDARIATEAEAAAGVSTTTLITPATLNSALVTSLWFFDKVGDLLAVTVPAGVDVIYRLGYYQRGDHEITRFKRKALSPTTAPTNNLAWEKDAAGVYFVNDMPRLDARTMGAFANGQQLNGSGTTNTMTAGSARLTLPGANFSAADVGKLIQVNGAGPLLENAPGDGIWTDWLTTTIAAYVSATEVDLATTATQTVTAAEAKTVFWVTDYTPALKNGQRAAATMGKFLYVPGGPNYFGSTASLCGINGYSNIRLEGDGSTSRIVSFAAQVAGDGSMFYIVGALVNRTVLLTPVLAFPLANTAGQDIIRVGSLVGMTVDSYFCLRDKTQPFYSLDAEEPFGVFEGWRGEIIRVREILDAEHIRVHAMLEENYAAAGALSSGLESDIRFISAVENVTIRNLALDMSKPMTTTNTGVIVTSRTLRLTVENVFFQHAVYGVTMGTSIDWAIRNCRFEWVGMLDGMQGDGDHDNFKAYGINVTSASIGGEIVNCSGRNVRHWITGSAASDMPPKHTHIRGITVQEGRVCIDTHPGADYWTLVDCHVQGGIWADEVDQYGYGFQLRGNHCDIIDCSASGVSIGIQPVFIEDTRIINFKADSCDVGISVYNCRDTEITNAKVTNCRVMGIYVHGGTSAPNPLQRFGYLKIKGFRLEGNPYQTSLVEDYRCDLPCGMQFGIYDSGGTFIPQWAPGITIEDWDMPDCVTPFMGADHEAVYGAGILDVATAQNLRREDVATAGVAMLASGTLFLSEIDLPIGRRIAKVGTLFAAAPVGQTNLWFGLFDKNRNCLAKSADLLAVAPSTTAVTLGTLDRVHTTKYRGRHYIGICQVAGTPSTVYGRSIAAAFAGLSPALAGSSNTALTTPASYPAISSATSTTLLTASMQFPAKKITTQSGKAFVTGMRVRIALTAAPTNYFEGVVTSYVSTTLWVDCDVSVGLSALDPATLNAWTITANAVATAITATGNLAFVVTA